MELATLHLSASYFAGLKESEMHNPEINFVFLEVAGLGFGGYGMGNTNVVGYILIMRGAPGVKKKRFNWIRENILFPFVDKVRKEYFKFDSSLGLVNKQGLLQYVFNILSEWCAFSTITMFESFLKPTPVSFTTECASSPFTVEPFNPLTLLTICLFSISSPASANVKAKSKSVVPIL